jgi:SNF2 family DNA or RNA helicase
MGYQHTLIPGAEAKIYDKINDLVMHKSRDELDMPGLSQNTIAVSLDIDARQVYTDMKRHLLAQLDEDNQVIAVNGAVMAGKLKQIANGAVYNEDRSTFEIHKEKISAVKELLDSLEGRPLLVFYEYHHDLERLLKAFPNTPVMGSSTNPKDAARYLDQWNKGLIPLMFLHPASAGHGLNMQSGRCSDVCFFSITWDQELHEQAIGRVWRQGVKSAVTVHYIVARNTIDERIMRVLHDKEALQSALLDALKK